MVESFEQLEKDSLSQSSFELSDIQKELINDSVNPEAFTDIVANPELLEQVVSEFDNRIQAFRPALSQAVNLSYMAGFSSDWDRIISQLEPRYLEAFTDLEQQNLIADYMVSIEDIRFDNWHELTIEQMVDVLGNMEQEIAKIEHRPATSLASALLEDDVFGQQYGGRIEINTKILEASKNNPALLDEILDTLIHEGRHAYQHYNVEERMVHQSQAEVNSWRENFQQLGYKNGSPITIHLAGPFSYTNNELTALGARLYYYQPVEIDAREFAADTMSKYHNRLQAMYS